MMIPSPFKTHTATDNLGLIFTLDQYVWKP